MIPRHPASFLLARTLLGALGIGAPAALVACGGKVVFDDGGGGAPGTSVVGPSATHASVTSTTTVASSTTSSSSGGCATQPPPQNHEYVGACFTIFDAPCPDPGDPFAFQEMSGLLNVDGPCEQDPDFCSCSTTVRAVLCAQPSQIPESCCYQVDVEHQKICEGRPFVVDREMRTAPVVRSSSWRVAFDLDAAPLDAETREAISRAWASDAAMEHASVASFGRFALELMAVGAPADLVRAAHEAALDEVKHAELCFGIASAFFTSDVGPGPLSLEGAFTGRVDLTALAVATVREGCVGETLAALIALEACERAESLGIREALAIIAADEARHAALAFRFVAWAVAQGGDPVRSAVARAFASVVVEAPSPDPEASIEALIAHGRLPARERFSIARWGLAEVVAPLARAMFSEGIAGELAGGFSGVS